MKVISLNITAIVLYFIGAIIISGSNIWMLIVGKSYPDYITSVVSSNLVSIFSVVVGAILTQVDIWNKNKELKSLKYTDSLPPV